MTSPLNCVSIYPIVFSAFRCLTGRSNLTYLRTLKLYLCLAYSSLLFPPHYSHHNSPCCWDQNCQYYSIPSPSYYTCIPLHSPEALRFEAVWSFSFKMYSESIHFSPTLKLPSKSKLTSSFLPNFPFLPLSSQFTQQPEWSFKSITKSPLPFYLKPTNCHTTVFSIK